LGLNLHLWLIEKEKKIVEKVIILSRSVVAWGEKGLVVAEAQPGCLQLWPIGASRKN
jgi:hypothetical protein